LRQLKSPGSVPGNPQICDERGPYGRAGHRSRRWHGGRGAGAGSDRGPVRHL